MTIAIFVLLCIAQAADVYTTLRAAKLPGVVESNPRLVKLFGKKPGIALLFLKAGVTAWVAYELHKAGWQAGNDYVSAIVVLSLVMGYAAHNNLAIARRLEK